MSKWSSKNNKPKFTPESTRAMVKMVKERRKISEIAQELNLREETIKNKLGLLGWSFDGLG